MKLVSLVTASLLLGWASCGEDYYAILGIGKEADNREIRKAFKKLALLHHPDKSKEPNAQEKFLKINKAYETLKDEESRKRYDRFGEESEETSRQSGGYQSWNYYHDDFGIYDDDPEIVTLDYHDFRRSVTDSYGYWFINFYSPQCSHCHDLAPTWRKVSRLLNGIVRIGAVNCQDDFPLCRQQNIRSYPSIIFFGPEGVIRFQGAKEEEELVEFVTQKLPDQLYRLRTENFNNIIHHEDSGGQTQSVQPWVIMFCADDDDFKCPEKNHRHLLANMMHGLVNFGVIDCVANKKLCQDSTGATEEEKEQYGTFYFSSSQDVSEKRSRRLATSDFRELADEILDILPVVPFLDDEQYSKFRLRLEDNLGPAWLVHFVFGNDGVSREEKKIPSLIPNLRFSRVDCTLLPEVCRELNIHKPQFVCFKLGGGYEVHYGRDFPSDVAEFARKSSQARTMKTLVTTDFPTVLNSQQGVFVDFFAPWCPPCLNLLPEYRKASTDIGGSIVFGTVDCTTQGRICDQFNIRSYPTTIFFNHSKPHYYQGEHSAGALADFVLEVLRPSVITLNYHSFHTLVGQKSESDMYLIDFYAPWCGPCMQLSPQWTKLAQLIKKIPEVKVAKVDCTVESDLCHEQAVRSYPTIRMYPLAVEGSGKYFVYTGFNRDAISLREWVFESLPAIVENLTPYTFQQKVAKGSRPALVDFYTPWCGHCQHFAPVYDTIALDLRDRVLAGKVNCERFQQLCSQAGVRAYPTVKFYPGLTDQGEEISSQNPDVIINFINDKLEAPHSHVDHDEL